MQAIEYLEGKIEQRVRQLPENYNPTGNAEHARLFHAAWEQAIDAIKALGNAGVPKSISKLEESIKEKRLLIEGRTAAIYSLQRISQKSPLKVEIFVDKLSQCSCLFDVHFHAILVLVIV